MLTAVELGFVEDSHHSLLFQLQVVMVSSFQLVISTVNKMWGVLGYQLGSVDAFTDPTVPKFVSATQTIDETIDGAYVDAGVD